MAKAYLNNQIKKLYNFTEKDFRKWCVDNNRKVSDKKSAIEFIKEIREKRVKGE